MSELTPDVSATPSQRFRARLLDALAPHAARLGWSAAAVFAAAREAGLSAGEAALAAPGGVDELIDAFADRADRVMAEGLLETDLASMKVRERVKAAIRLRIEAQTPYKEAVRRMGFALASPMRPGLGPKLIWRTADRIWRAIGDSSTDANFYSKRAILSGVLAATYARWLSDEDPACAATWAFLDARIDAVMRFEKLKARLRPLSGGAELAVGVLSRLRYR